MLYGLKKRFVSILFSVLMVLALVVPAVPVTEVGASNKEASAGEEASNKEASAESKTAYKKKPRTAMELTPKLEENKAEAAHVVRFGQKGDEALEWYVIGCDGKGIASEAGTLTLLAKAPLMKEEAFAEAESGNAYGASNIKSRLEALAADSKIFSAAEQSVLMTRKLAGGSTTGGQNADYVSGDAVEAKLWLLSAAEAGMLDSSLLKAAKGSWWLRSPGPESGEGLAGAAAVDGGEGKVTADAFISPEEKGGVRPALQVGLASVTLESKSETVTKDDKAVEITTLTLVPVVHSVTLTGGDNATPEGSTSQTEVAGEMSEVTFRADEGYHFPEFGDVTVDGVTVTRTSEDLVTVSGSPTADVSMEVQDAVATTYTVTLDNQEATTKGAASVTATVGEVLPGISENLPEKTGYVFGGYFSAVNGGGTQYLNADGTATTAVWETKDDGIIYALWTAKAETPTGVTFTATGADTGTLSGAGSGMKYCIDDGDWTTITENEDITLSDLSACTIYVVTEGEGTTTVDSDALEIAVTKAETPSTPTAVSCTAAANNDGQLTGITSDMEYKRSDADEWTAGSGSDVISLKPGTYYVRVKANGTALASDHQELTIKKYITATVTFKVENGAWDSGESDDVSIPLEGSEGELRLEDSQIPAVGGKPKDGYKAGSWDVTPGTETDITEDTTYTYTYAAKETAAVTTKPAKKTLTYNGQAQALVTAGEATGGEVWYALGGANGPTGSYSADIPAKTEAGTYRVYYKVVAEEGYLDSEAAYVDATISPAEVTITAEDKSSKYKEDIKALTYKISGSVAKGDDLAVELSCKATSTSPAGEYPISISWSNDANYKATLVKGTYTISYVYISLTFNTNGGSEVADQQVIKYKTAQKPTDPTRSGYSFKGWYSDKALTKTFDFSTVLTKDTVIYAGWTGKTYTRTKISGTTTDASHIWTKGSTSDVVITIEGNGDTDESFSHFSSVRIDGVTKQKNSDYTVRKGSTIVTIKAATLQRLVAGTHNVRVVFDNGYVDTTLTVKAAPTSTPTPRPTATTRPTSTPRPTITRRPTSTPRPTATRRVTATPTNSRTNPKTGDTSNIWLWAALLAVSAIGLVAAYISRRKS